MEKWLKVKEVSEALSLTPRTIHKLIKEGQIPAKKIKDYYRIPESGLVEFLNKN